MASSAKACPKCGAKNKKPIYKKISFWIFIILLALIVGTYVSCSGVLNGADATVTTSTGEKVKISADELRDFYRENELKFNELYSGQSVTITGKVKDISGSTNYNGVLLDGYINIEDGNARWMISFAHTESNWKNFENIISKLSAGDTITVTGRVTVGTSYGVEVRGVKSITMN